MSQDKVKGGRASSTDEAMKGQSSLDLFHLYLLLLSKETVLSVCLSVASEKRAIVSLVIQTTSWKGFQICVLYTYGQQCRQNLLLVDFSGFVMGPSLSLKLCYIKVFLKEEVLRNSLEKEIAIVVWKVFASSHLLIQVKMIKLMIRLLYMGEKKAKNKVGEQKQHGLCREGKVRTSIRW